MNLRPASSSGGAVVSSWIRDENKIKERREDEYLFIRVRAEGRVTLGQL